MQEMKKKLEELKKTASVEFWSAPNSVRASLEGMVKAAKAELKELKFQLAGKAMENANVLVLTDKITASEFVNDAEIPDNCVLMDHLLLEKELFKKVFAGNRTSYTIDSTFTSMINKSLIDITNTFNPSVEWASPIIVPAARYTSFKEKKDALIFIKNILIETYGIDMKALFLMNRIRDIIADNIENFLDSTLICLVNCPKNEAEALNYSSCKIVEKIKKDEIKDFIVNNSNFDKKPRKGVLRNKQ